MQLTKNFSLHEFYTHDGTPVPERYMDNVRELAKNLQHLTASAADVTAKNYTPKRLTAVIERLIKEGKVKQGGIGIYPGFTHYDIRGKKARW